MPATALTALIAAIFTAAVALAGVYLTNRGNAQRLAAQLDHELREKRAELVREKGEELYVLTGAWLNELATNYLRVATVMKGTLSYRDYIELTLKRGDPDYDFNRLRMLVDIYFSQLKESFARVLEARSRLNAIDLDHKRSHDRGDTDGSRFLGPYLEAQKALEAKGEEFRREIAKQVQEA